MEDTLYEWKRPVFIQKMSDDNLAYDTHMMACYCIYKPSLHTALQLLTICKYMKLMITIKDVLRGNGHFCHK